jgi:hypothetical protein
MANVAAHRALALKPETVITTIKATAHATDLEAGGFTINVNPENIVSSIARTAEGVVTITLAQAWAALDNCLVSLSLDDHTVTLDSEDVSDSATPQIVLTTRTGGADADADAGVFRITLVLRLQ